METRLWIAMWSCAILSAITAKEDKFTGIFFFGYAVLFAILFLITNEKD